MRLLRGVLGALMWVLAAVLGLVGVILCVTLVLLPLGIPILALAARMFRNAVQLMLPRSVAHPVRELGKSADKGRSMVKDAASDVSETVSKKGRKAIRRQRKRLA